MDRLEENFFRKSMYSAYKSTDTWVGESLENHMEDLYYSTSYEDTQRSIRIKIQRILKEKQLSPIRRLFKKWLG